MEKEGVRIMATETFDKTIWIDEKAAEIIANELEKPKIPYIPKYDILYESGCDNIASQKLALSSGLLEIGKLKLYWFKK